jgi:hypothetical protein
MSSHHTLQAWLNAYVAAADIGDDRKGWLFRTAEGRSVWLTDRPMRQPDAYRMIQRHAAAIGFATRIGCHSCHAG